MKQQKKPASQVDTVRNNVTLRMNSLLPPLDQQYFSDAHLVVHLRHQVVMLDGETATATSKQSSAPDTVSGQHFCQGLGFDRSLFTLGAQAESPASPHRRSSRSVPTDGSKTKEVMEIFKDQSSRETFYRDEHLFVDLLKHVVILDSETVRLTRMEYRLLALLVERAGQVVPRANLLLQVCGYVAETRTRALDMHVRRLRKKLGHAGQCIATIIGRGYCFSPLHGLHHPGPSEPDALANNRTVIWPPAMACQTCADLLANLKRSVDLYKKAVRNVLERVGDHHEAAIEQTERLRPEYLAAIDALMAHRREDHGSFAKKSDS